MLDASVTLMNQYTAVTSSLPSFSHVPTPQPSTSDEDAMTSDILIPIYDESAASTASVAPTLVAATPGPSTTAAAAAPAASTSAAATPSAPSASSAAAHEVVKLEDIGSEEHADAVISSAGQYAAGSSTDAASELRRRRLEKFLKTEQQPRD